MLSKLTVELAIFLNTIIIAVSYYGSYSASRNVGAVEFAGSALCVRQVDISYFNSIHVNQQHPKSLWL